MKEKLTENITKNEERLAQLNKKKENLEREITLLQRKIENQKHALNNLKVD